jgi:beta-glucosidase
MKVPSPLKKLALAGALLFPVQVFTASYQYPFQNPALPLEQRVTNVISLLNQSEKIQLLNSSGSNISRLGFTTTGQGEGYHGVCINGPAGWGSGMATQFCQAYGLGETWDPSMVQLALGQEATEFRYMKGGLVTRAPNCDLGRDPRWGRTEECYGECPFLVGTLTQGAVRGLQGNDPRYLKCAALMKHFLANSNENTRGSSSSNFDQRLFREYYSMPFRMGAEAGAECLMTAYNKVNGIPCIVHPVVRNVAMKDWGMNGIFVTDGGGLGVLVNSHRYYPDVNVGSAECVKAGITEFLDDLYKTGIPAALSANQLTIAQIDSALKGNFRMFFRLGLLDPAAQVPYTNVGTVAPWTMDSVKTMVRHVTQKSIVLLKNTGNLLPLSKTSLRSIAVIGENADSVCIDWYGGKPPYKVSALAGIRAMVGSAVTVNYARTNTNSAAVSAAKSSDVALVVVGNHPVCNAGWAQCPEKSEGKEARDRETITFESLDENLIRDVYAANPKTIVLILSSFPFAATWAQANVPAILHMTHSSQELGNALADVLFGDYNPAGRTSQTWVASVNDLPSFLDYNIRLGRTYMYFTGTPLYPFGHGLSYTTFTYANLHVSDAVFDAKKGVTVSVDITNSGARAGEEVVQMYVKHTGSAVSRPIKELRGFQRVAIAAGETKTVTMALPGKSLAYWDSTRACWVVENDNIQIQAGASSADIRLTANLQVTNGGCIDITAINENFPGSTTRRALTGAPFAIQALRRHGPAVELLIRLNTAADIDLRLYDLKGSLVGHVSRKSLGEGTHLIAIPAPQFAAGVYCIRGTIGENVVATRTCIR